MTKFKTGQRVKLKANKEEGWPEETGVIEGPDGKNLYVVRVDVKCRVKGDDGLRGGVTPDQMVRISS